MEFINLGPGYYSCIPRRRREDYKVNLNDILKQIYNIENKLKKT